MRWIKLFEMDGASLVGIVAGIVVILVTILGFGGMCVYVDNNNNRINKVKQTPIVEPFSYPTDSINQTPPIADTSVISTKTSFQIFHEENEGTFKILQTYVRDYHCAVLEGVKTKQRMRTYVDREDVPLTGEIWLTRLEKDDIIRFVKKIEE